MRLLRELRDTLLAIYGNARHTPLLSFFSGRGLLCPKRILFRLGLGLGLIFVTLGLALFMAPPTWLDYGLLRISRGNLAMTATSGSLWKGNGTLQALLPHGAALTLGRLQWHIYLSDVAAPRLSINVLSSLDGSPVLLASLGSDGTVLHALRLSSPAALLGALTPSLHEIDPGGQLTISAENFSIANGRASGTATVLWQEATSRLAQVRTLGNYQLVFKGVGEQLAIELSTVAPSVLTLTAQGRWQPGGALTIDGEARIGPDHARELVPLLRILGRETSPGVYQLQLNHQMGAV